MAVLFDRAVSVFLVVPNAGDFNISASATDFEVTGLRVKFKIEKSLSAHPNTAEIIISNLNKDSRARMAITGAAIILQAGYRENFGQIFSGDVRTADPVKEGSEYDLVIRCGDGERAYKFAMVSESFAAGTPARDVITKIAKSFKLGMGNLLEATSGVSRVYEHGVTVHGRAVRELDRLLAAEGLEWSVQGGALQVIKPGGLGSNRIVSLSAQTGLIGSPEHGSPRVKNQASTIKVKALLQHEIQPGHDVEILSEKVNGIYRVNKVTHTGDTGSYDWYSEMEVTSSTSTRAAA